MVSGARRGGWGGWGTPIWIATLAPSLLLMPQTPGHPRPIGRRCGSAIRIGRSPCQLIPVLTDTVEVETPRASVRTARHGQSSLRPAGCRDLRTGYNRPGMAEVLRIAPTERSPLGPPPA